MSEDQLILVDEADREVGVMGKLAAHQQGLLHRAISVFVFNDKKELLLQRRALHKYHSPGEWTNTCCSHPAPGEETIDAAHRRLKEEMGLQTELTFAFTFLYHAPFDNGLTEHELDHVFIGYSDQEPILNPEEAAEYKWASLVEIRSLAEKQPDSFTVWFKLIYDRVFTIVGSSLPR